VVWNGEREGGREGRDWWVCLFVCLMVEGEWGDDERSEGFEAVLFWDGLD
jgi:hypothetical protein